MICFHFTTFAVLETTDIRKLTIERGCDLLSFYYLCRTGNNVRLDAQLGFEVVICFHFTTFAVLETTNGPDGGRRDLLWFAFILLPLPYWKQQTSDSIPARLCCDLLSFYYLCRTGNNTPIHAQPLPPLWFAFILLPLPYWKQRTKTMKLLGYVVICFHFTTFAVLETTSFAVVSCLMLLWFAFILLPLPYWKQHLVGC